MKKIILSILSVAFISLSANSQSQSIDLNNTRPGESVEYCAEHKLYNYWLSTDPNAQNILNQNEIIRQQELLNPQPQLKATVLTIPVVFHVLHNGGGANIGDAQLQDQIRILNEDYLGLNQDIDNVDPEFLAFADTADIQFVLAKKAPDGTCFSGITRTQSVATNSGGFPFGGTNQVNAIIAGNDVYNGTWPGNQYLNVFIVNNAGTAAGYTTNPGTAFPTGSMNDGIWILHQYIGSIGSGNVTRSRALTHEVGHWLNLSHPWGSTNDPGVSANCTVDDGVQDTPTCAGTTTCDLNINSCSQDNAYWGYDKKDNIENFMEYSYCSKMYTIGQVARMRTALQSSIGGRSNLYSPGNINFTGADGTLYLCQAKFSSDKIAVCQGGQVQFTDESYNGSTSWNWSFPGADVPTSIAQNPIVTYSTPGLYSVTLVASDGVTSKTETKTNYIRVSNSSSSTPFFEGFENLTTLTDIAEWQITNENGNMFEITSSASHLGAKSAKLSNFNELNGYVDELISAPIDLSNITGSVTLSYRYAYNRKDVGDNDQVKLYVSNNCGDTWSLRDLSNGSNISSTVLATPYTPTLLSDWTTVHITNIDASFWTNDFKCKFEFTSGGGNNYYIDNINIYEGAPSSDVVTNGIGELSTLSNLNLYPNPVEDVLNIKFDVASNLKVKVSVLDVTGKSINNYFIEALSGKNKITIDTQKMQAGVYFMNIEMNGSSQTKKFIVK